MHNYTREDILQLVEEEDVAFIRLQFTDIFGMMKNMAVTVSQLEKALDNRCMFDVSSVEGLSCEEDSDMYLYPDPRTFEIFPWRPQQGKVARLICDVYRPDGTPYEVDPRYVLKKAIAEAAEEGYTMNVGPECEFFLFHTDDDGLPTTLTHEKAGYFDVGPLDLGENARRDMVLTLEDMGFEIETEMTIFALEHNFHIVERPIAYRDRPSGSVSKLNTVSDGIKILSTIGKRFAETKPGICFSAISAAAFTVCAATVRSLRKDELNLKSHLGKAAVAIGCVLVGVVSFWVGIVLSIWYRQKKREFEHTLSLLQKDEMA